MNTPLLNMRYYVITEPFVFGRFTTDTKHLKYGENYKQIIQSKWEARKLSRQLPLHNKVDTKRIKI